MKVSPSSAAPRPAADCADAPLGAPSSGAGHGGEPPANVYQLLLARQGPLIVRRNSWRVGLAEVVGTYPPVAEWSAGAAPYFGNPLVFALVKYNGAEPYLLECLSGPGTYGYRRAYAPMWWRAGLRYPLRGWHKGLRFELRSECFVLLSQPR